MKNFWFIAVISFLTLAGCSNGKIDTAALKSTFQGAPDSVKTELDNGIAALNATNYDAAATSFNKVAYGTKMTKEQRNAIEDALAKTKARMKK